MATRKSATRPAGVLRPELLARHSSLERVDPSPELAPWVQHHWLLSWDLPSGTTFPSELLAHPAANLSVELGHARDDVGDDRVVITGVATRRFDVRLAGWGWVLGVRFRPGGLAALTGLDAAALTDRTRARPRLLPAGVVSRCRRSRRRAPRPTRPRAVAEAALGTLRPRSPTPSTTSCSAWSTTCGTTAAWCRWPSSPSVTACRAAGWSGCSAATSGSRRSGSSAATGCTTSSAALDAGYDGTLADLAASLGWYDQAHFTRDFTRHVGVPPRAYRS